MEDVRPGELGGASKSSAASDSWPFAFRCLVSRRPWNSVVRGEDQGDGWLKVLDFDRSGRLWRSCGISFQVADGRYLPMRVNGVWAAQYCIVRALFPALWDQSDTHLEAIQC